MSWESPNSYRGFFPPGSRPLVEVTAGLLVHSRALTAAQRAVEVSPSSHLSCHALAEALFSQREIHSFRSAAERTLWLNRMDGSSMAFLGMLLAYAGDRDRACTLAETGMPAESASPRILLDRDPPQR